VSIVGFRHCLRTRQEPSHGAVDGTGTLSGMKLFWRFLRASWENYQESWIEKMWENAIVVYFARIIIPTFDREDWGKNENLSHDSRPPVQDLKSGSSKGEADVLMDLLRCSITRNMSTERTPPLQVYQSQSVNTRTESQTWFLRCESAALLTARVGSVPRNFGRTANCTSGFSPKKLWPYY